MADRRVAVVESIIVPGGGTEAVAAWSIEALKKTCQVSLITFSQVDAGTLNRYYGTALEESEFSIIRPPLLPLLRRTNRFSILKDHLMMRYCKSVGDEFDLFFCMGGIMDFGRPAMQYVAFAPASTFVKVSAREPGMPWWYYWPKKTFMGVCESISGYSEESVRQNITLATSKWTGEIMEAIFSVDDYEVVYPPVDAPTFGTPWQKRQEGFLCVARIVPEKMVDQAIEILQRVRQMGFDVSLHIIGRQDDPRYFQKIKELSADNASWIFLHGVLPKDELFRLMSENKYGINPAYGEPSGVAALEMVKAGCIVFMRDGGGLPEIVDTPELTYHSVDDGVAKISEILSSEPAQSSILERLDRQGELFSTQVFCQTIQRVTDEYFSRQ